MNTNTSRKQTSEAWVGDRKAGNECAHPGPGVRVTVFDVDDIARLILRQKTRARRHSAETAVDPQRHVQETRRDRRQIAPAHQRHQTPDVTKSKQWHGAATLAADAPVVLDAGDGLRVQVVLRGLLVEELAERVARI